MTFEEMLAQFAAITGRGGDVSTAAAYAPQAETQMLDAGLGPVSDTTRAGLQQGFASLPQPSAAGRYGNALLEYGKLPAQLATELTGVPSMVRGGERIGQAAYDGDGLGMIAGGAEAALGMVPVAATTRVGRAAMAPMFSTVPRAMATGAAAMAPEAAYAARGARRQAEQKAAETQPDGLDAMRKAVSGDPQLEALLSQWQQKNVQSTQNVRGVNRESADKIRAQAAEDAQRLWADLLAGVDAKRRENAPFRERHPGMAEAIGYTTAGLATALPFANTVKTRLARSMIENPRINKAAETLEAAFENARTPTAKIAGMQDQLARRVSDYEAATSKTANALNFGKNVGLSGLLAFEGSSVPEQIDALAFAPKHPVREAARAELTNEDYYANRVPAAALSGLMTAGLGMKAGAVSTPGGAPRDMSRAKELIQRGSPESLDRIRNLQAYRDLSRSPGGRGTTPTGGGGGGGQGPQGTPPNQPSNPQTLHNSRNQAGGPPPNGGPQPSPNPGKPSAPRDLTPPQKNKLLEAVASGKPVNALTPPKQQYMDYLNELSTALGVPVQDMARMIKDGAKKGPWAIPLAVGATAYATKDGE